MVAARASLDGGQIMPAENSHARLASYVRSLMPEPGGAAGSGSGASAADVSFAKDIYQGNSAAGQNALKAIEAAGGNISFTTPGQDKSSNAQPDYYLNSEGKLVANPNATPSKDGKVSIEVEGNNSAKQAKQYADQLQKASIRDLVAMYKAANPGAKVPEMWQSILDSQPDGDYPNTGDSENNNSVTPQEQQAYNSDSNTTSTPPPSDSTSTPSTTTSGSDAPSTSAGGSSAGSDAAPSSYSGGSDGGGGGSSSGGGGGGSDSSSGGGGSDSSAGTPVTPFSDSYNGPASSDAVASIGLKAGEEGANLWAQSPFAGSTDNGIEGCAASVSVILADAGYPQSLMSAGVDQLVSNMESKAGWTQDNTISNAKPGDIIYGDNGGSDQHIGVVVEKGGQLYCCDNDSYPSGGGAPHMILEPLNSCYIVEHFGSNAHLVVPPASDSGSGSQPSSSAANDAQPKSSSANEGGDKPKPSASNDSRDDKPKPKETTSSSTSTTSHETSTTTKAA